MGSLHSILQKIGFRDNTNTYTRVLTDDPDQTESETTVVNETSEQQRHSHHSITETIDQRYSLIWLDEHSNTFSLDTEYTKNILCKFNPQCCSFYVESDEFLNDIQTGKYGNNKILLIVSGSLAEQLLPKIKSSVPVVIIFCGNYNKYIKLKTSEYPNVVDVCTDYQTLKNLIQRELSSLKFCLNENVRIKSLKLLISKTRSDGLNNDSNSIILNETSFYYILIVDLLKQMPQTNESKDIWLNKCREYYRGKTSELQKIEKFSKEYKADKAIRWYTKDSFVHILVNRTFRTEDITLWYLSRYFIADICKEIEIVYQKQKIYSENLTLYRGQRMSIKELESIRELAEIDGLFCTTAFFSTTQNISVAKSFSGDVGDPDDDEIVSVLFKIIVDSINLETVKFVNINQYLIDKSPEFIDEEEFLFTIGSIFRIMHVKQDSEKSKLWYVYMIATDDGADIVQNHLDLMRNKYKDIKINLRFGLYLLDMNYLGRAESYFQMLLHELERSNYKQRYDEDLALVNNLLGELNMRTTNYKEAYQYFQNALTIRSNNQTSANLCTSYIYFGNYYKAIDDPLQAHEYYKKALIIMNENSEKNKINIDKLNINIASIYATYGDYYRSLKLSLETQNSLKKIQSIYPLYSEMIICQGLIGDIYFIKENYIEAEKYYLNVFNMCKQYLCIGDKQFIHCIYSLTELYRKKFNDNNQNALKFCEKQLELHRQHLSQNHLSVAHLLMKLGDIKQDISYYQKALEILNYIDHREYLTIAKCHKFIGDYYLKNQQIDQNIKEVRDNYYKTREIYKKIYSENHHRIDEIKHLIHSNEQRSETALEHTITNLSTRSTTSC
jgi:tetratricopeptide (TPR) repeat protein